MWGVSLVPESSYPDDNDVVFLPTQAAADNDIYKKVTESLEDGSKIIMTSGFLSSAADGEKFARLAGVKWPLKALKDEIESIELKDSIFKLPVPLKTGFLLEADGADVLLNASEKLNNPYMLSNKTKNVYVINNHTFSQEDFTAAGEHLLAPRPLGLVELPREWVNEIREAFHGEGEPVIDAPARVAVQQLSDGSLVIHNYNQEAVTVIIKFPEASDHLDNFTGEPVTSNGNELKIVMKARSNIWLKTGK
jgi:hypothetical protein